MEKYWKGVIFMLANNNKLIINKLAGNQVRTDKRQFGILFFTIMLSSFLVFSILTMGLAYLDLSRLQNVRLYGSEYDIALMNGFTDQQRETAAENPDVETVGILAYSGYVKSTDTDSSVNAGLLWGDEIFWKNQKAPARTDMEGRYPNASNELLATREALKECGKDTLSVGDCFSMTYEDNTGIHTKEFVISGIWKGYGKDNANFYVSRDFYQQSGYDLKSDGILQIKFKRNYVSGKTIGRLEESLHLSQQQVFQPSDYIEKSLTILLALWGLCLIICLNAYLLVYNILYLSVSGKTRYYGLLQTLGMTKKQLARLIRRQMTLIGITGTAAGTSLGIFISLFLLPHVMKILGISPGNVGLRFYPSILVLSIFTTGAAILRGIRTPLHIAVSVTPVEAVRYRVNDKTAGKDSFKTCTEGKNLYWNMAKDQLRKDKKKTIIVFLSLAVSLSVFYCLTTIIDSQGKRNVYPNYWDADFILTNQSQTTKDISSLKPAISEKFMTELKKTEGVAEVHAVRGIPVIFPYQAEGFSDFWLKGYTRTKPYLSYDEILSDYQKHPEKYYGMVKGIEEDEFDFLNESLENTVNKEDFLSGNTAVLIYAGFEIPQNWIGAVVPFTVENQTHEITIGAVSCEGSYGASTNCGANLIVSESYLKTLVTETPDILRLIIKYQQSYSEKTERAVNHLLAQNPYRKDLFYSSKYEDMKTIQDSQGKMFEIGTVTALLLLLVGMLNYRNTIACSIQNRRLTFSIMESVGMSRKQVLKLLIREGLMYAGGSVFLTVSGGTGITYLVFQSMNYMKIPFAVPLVPLLCAVILVTLLCVITPVASYRKIVGFHSIAQRLREYE